MRRTLPALAGLPALLVVACTDPGASVAPAAAWSAARSADVSAAASRGRASGHADVQGTPVQNVRDQTYSFTAVATGEGLLARGAVSVHYVRFTGEEIAAHATVTCLSVVGEQAWVGARVDRYVRDGETRPEFVGLSMIFRVRDMGEGHGTADLASLTFFVEPQNAGLPFLGGTIEGADLAYCSARPAFPILRESGSGNIQVEP